MTLAKDPRRRQRLSANRLVERQAKEDSKLRDGLCCRVPWCNYDGYALHSAHQKHKGMGGNPTGDRNTTAGLMTVCAMHHREGKFALDKGTLRYVALDPEAVCNGPVSWQAKVEGRWLEVATETITRHSETTWRWLKLGSYELLRHLDRVA